MRKVALKKKYPNRHNIIKTLRKKHVLNEVVTKSGRSVYLNFMKHILYGRPYINEEYQKEMNRKMKRMKKKEEINHND